MANARKALLTCRDERRGRYTGPPSGGSFICGVRMAHAAANRLRATATNEDARLGQVIAFMVLLE